MHRKLHELMTNTTSLVGYIAILMFAGAYVGGDKGITIDPALLKGSIMENSQPRAKSIFIMIDGRQYRAQVQEEVSMKPAFQY